MEKPKPIPKDCRDALGALPNSKQTCRPTSVEQDMTMSKEDLSKRNFTQPLLKASAPMVTHQDSGQNQCLDPRLSKSLHGNRVRSSLRLYFHRGPRKCFAFMLTYRLVPSAATGGAGLPKEWPPPSVWSQAGSWTVPNRQLNSKCSAAGDGSDRRVLPRPP